MPLKQANCAYCGNNDQTTTEHVVARCFFEQSPSDPIIVRACSVCEDRKQYADQRLRDALVMGADVFSSPPARRIFDDKVKPALRQGDRAGFKRSIGFLNYRADGRATVGVDANLIDEGLSWIVRGLYYHHKQRVLPETGTYRKVLILAQSPVAPMLNLLAKDGMPQMTSIGPEFQYAWQVSSDDHLASRWILNFYNSFVWCVTTSKISASP